MLNNIAQTDKKGKEYWPARDLYPIFGYSSWQSFKRIIDKAKHVCENLGHKVREHFHRTTKTVYIGKGGKMEIENFELSSYACNLIAMVGRSNKPEIRQARAYFSKYIQKTEEDEKCTKLINVKDLERIAVRESAKQEYKNYSKVISDNIGVDDKRALGKIIKKITNAGDRGLFGKGTGELKDELRIPEGKPLDDGLHPLPVKVRSFRAALCSYTVDTNEINNPEEIENINFQIGKDLNGVCDSNGIQLKDLLVSEDSEDIGKLKRRVVSDINKELKE